MNVSLSYKLRFLILLVFAGNVAVAQDQATAKFLDSLKNPPPVAVDTVAVSDSSIKTEDNEQESAAGMPVDTAVISDLRETAADTIALLKKDKGFYYQEWLDSLLRAEEGKVKITRKPPRLPDLAIFFDVLQIVLWVLAGAVLLFILYKLFMGKGALFLKNRKNIDAVINIQDEEIPAAHYGDQIKKAETSGNYRLAVRYLHLQALYHLSEKGCIGIATSKTNYEYMNELRKTRPPVANHFSALTSKYEYIWYGEYAIADKAYYLLKDDFTQFNTEIETG